MDDKTAAHLLKRLKASASILGFGSEAEEISQAVLTRMLEGRHKHATCEQAVIDYLRSNYGRKGEPSYDLRQAFTLKRLSFEEYFIEHPGQFGTESPNRSYAFDILGYFRGVERAMFLLNHYWGFNEVEIGNLFGVSESRVSQRLQSLQGRLSARIKAEAWNERKREGKMEGILLPEAESESGLEQGTFERMEIGQSWQMEKLNEESF